MPSPFQKTQSDLNNWPPAFPLPHFFSCWYVLKSLIEWIQENAGTSPFTPTKAEPQVQATPSFFAQTLLATLGHACTLHSLGAITLVFSKFPRGCCWGAPCSHIEKQSATKFTTTVRSVYRAPAVPLVLVSAPGVSSQWRHWPWVAAFEKQFLLVKPC